MPKLTIGITTYNEKNNIEILLNLVLSVCDQDIEVILYDDFSQDGTREIIESHPLYRHKKFRCYFSPENSGGPAAGRSYIAEYSGADYVTLVDGDDKIEPTALAKVFASLPQDADVIVTPFVLRGKLRPLFRENPFAKVQYSPRETGWLTVESANVMRLISGIGGKIYDRHLLRNCARETVLGKGDDARLNLRILTLFDPKIYYISEPAYYLIERSRKSQRSSSITFSEISERVRTYHDVMNKYGVDRRYIAALERAHDKIIERDNIGEERKGTLKNELRAAMRGVERVVFLCSDISAIGGISGRIVKTLNASRHGRTEYLCISKNNVNAMQIQGCLVANGAEEQLIDTVRSWSQKNTVFVCANNTLRIFSKRVQQEIEKFPLMYMASGQLAFMVQDSKWLGDLDYVRAFKASAIISLSSADINFQKQLGIHGQVKGFLPVEVRESNTFNPGKNRYVGYVGRIDFHAKDCERLIDAAIGLRNSGQGRLKVFTTRGANSPDYDRLRALIDGNGLEECFDFVLECREREKIYDELSVLFLPSKKESFGNVVLEAFSFGIPVVAASYAPGPAELVKHGETGFLLPELTPGTIANAISALDGPRLAQMSAAAFDRHKSYSMESYLDFIESLAGDVLARFRGRNELQVFPELKLAHELSELRNNRSGGRDAASVARAEIRKLANENAVLVEEMAKLRSQRPAMQTPPPPSAATSQGIGTFELVGQGRLLGLAQAVEELEERRRHLRAKLGN